MRGHEYLDKQLEELDITNADLARMIGVAQSSVQRWTKGKIEVPLVLTKLLEALITIKRANEAATKLIGVSWSNPSEVLQDKLEGLTDEALSRD